MDVFFVLSLAPVALTSLQVLILFRPYALSRRFCLFYELIILKHLQSLVLLCYNLPRSRGAGNRMRWRKILKKLLFPGGWVVLLCAAAAAGGLSYVFAGDTYLVKTGRKDISGKGRIADKQRNAP